MPRTMQETFDTVARHLLTQGEKATDLSGGCTYRNEKNQSCAVGCLIPKELYSTELEGKKVKILPPPILELLGRSNIALLTDLQDCHDDVDAAEWPIELGCIAKYWELNPSIIDTVQAELAAKAN